MILHDYVGQHSFGFKFSISCSYLLYNFLLLNTTTTTYYDCLMIWNDKTYASFFMVVILERTCAYLSSLHKWHFKKKGIENVYVSLRKRYYIFNFNRIFMSYLFGHKQDIINTSNNMLEKA